MERHQRPGHLPFPRPAAALTSTTGERSWRIRGAIPCYRSTTPPGRVQRVGGKHTGASGRGEDLPPGHPARAPHKPRDRT